MYPPEVKMENGNPVLPVPPMRPREGPTVWFRRESDAAEFGVRIYTDDGRQFTAEYKRLQTMARLGTARMIEAPTPMTATEDAVDQLNTTSSRNPSRSTQQSRAEKLNR